jgi:hypothetical protein
LQYTILQNGVPSSLLSWFKNRNNEIEINENFSYRISKKYVEVFIPSNIVGIKHTRLYKRSTWLNNESGWWHLMKSWRVEFKNISQKMFMWYMET